MFPFSIFQDLLFKQMITNMIPTGTRYIKINEVLILIVARLKKYIDAEQTLFWHNLKMLMNPLVKKTCRHLFEMLVYNTVKLANNDKHYSIRLSFIDDD